MEIPVILLLVLLLGAKKHVSHSIINLFLSQILQLKQDLNYELFSDLDHLLLFLGLLSIHDHVPLVRLLAARDSVFFLLWTRRRASDVGRRRWECELFASLSWRSRFEVFVEGTL